LREERTKSSEDYLNKDAVKYLSECCSKWTETMWGGRLLATKQYREDAEGKEKRLNHADGKTE